LNLKVLLRTVFSSLARVYDSYIFNSVSKLMDYLQPKPHKYETLIKTIFLVYAIVAVVAVFYFAFQQARITAVLILLSAGFVGTLSIRITKGYWG